MRASSAGVSSTELPIKNQPLGEVRPRPSSPVADIVVLFESAEEFQRRPRYRSALQIGPDEFGQIVGKYELPEAREYQTECGLNGCTRRHRFGYVISNTDGDETTCGHICGEGAFGVKFREVVAQMKARFDEQARQEVLKALMPQQPVLEARARALLGPVAGAARDMLEFYRDFQSKERFWRELGQVARLGGEIRTAADDQARGGVGQSAVALKTIGRLEGVSVLLDVNVRVHEHRLRHSVLPWLRDELGAPNVALRSQKALEKLLTEASTMRQHLADAETFIRETERFLTPSNLVQLELVRKYLMPSHGEQQALKRAVKRWGAVPA